MVIEANKNILVIRFFQYRSVDFIREHNQLVEKNGFVWLLKTGRKIPISSLEAVLSDSGLIVFKAPKRAGGKYYLSQFTDYYNGTITKNTVYPSYYNDLCSYSFGDGFMLDGTWLKIQNIISLPADAVDHFFLKSNGNKLAEVVGKTRTSVLYAFSDVDILL